jgi:hypothetical protein
MLAELASVIGVLFLCQEDCVGIVARSYSSYSECRVDMASKEHFLAFAIPIEDSPKIPDTRFTIKCFTALPKFELGSFQ